MASTGRGGGNGAWLTKMLDKWSMADVNEFVDTLNLSDGHRSTLRAALADMSCDGSILAEVASADEFCEDLGLPPDMKGAARVAFDGFQVHTKELSSWSTADVKAFVKSRKYLKKGELMGTILSNVNEMECDGDLLASEDTVKGLKDGLGITNGMIARKFYAEIQGFKKRGSAKRAAEAQAQQREAEVRSQKAKQASQSVAKDKTQNAIAAIYAGTSSAPQSSGYGGGSSSVRKQPGGGGGGGTFSMPQRSHTFDLNLIGKAGRLHKLSNVSTDDRVADVKRRIVDEIGGEGKAMSLRYLGKTLDDRRSLGSYGIDSDKETVMITFKVVGGMAKAKESREIQSSLSKSDFHVFNPRANPAIPTTEQPDCILGFDEPDNPRVRMPCGHPFCAETLFQILKALFEKDINAYKVYCPLPKCKKEWQWVVLKKAAALTGDEMRLFTKWIAYRSQREQARECPSCGTFCERPKALNQFRVACVCRTRDFCWQCGKIWRGSGMQMCGNTGCSCMFLQKELDECPVFKAMGQTKQDIPKLRACPRCLSVVEYDSACKHMKCWSCAKKFCFRCLALQGDNGKWACTTGDSYSAECPVAPRQKLK